MQKSDDETKKSLEAKGVRSRSCPPRSASKFKDLMKGVAKTWADGLDGRGKRGSDALKEFDASGRRHSRQITRKTRPAASCTDTHTWGGEFCSTEY